MKQLSPLVWKEWHEAQVYLWIGLAIFLGLPLIGGIEDSLNRGHRLEVEALPWVTAFGGVLAIFTAVGATCRDLSGPIEDFWRAAPVSVSRWMLIKFMVGVVVVVLASAIPLSVEACFARQVYALEFLRAFSLFLVAVYGLAFSSGCLLRRTAHAAMVALAGMLLIYCLPLIVPPLNRFVAGAPIGFCLAMSGVGIVTLLLAILAVRRSWIVESGRKLIYGCVAAVLLLLLASASYELGSNLPVLQSVDIPDADHLQEITVTGNSGAIISARSRYSRDGSIAEYSTTTFDIGPEGLKVGPTKVEEKFPGDFSRNNGSAISYSVGTEQDSRAGPLKLWAWQSNSDESSPSKRLLDVSLWDLDQQGNDGTYVFEWQNRLYILGLSYSWHRDSHDRRVPGNNLVANQLAVLDLTQPLKPRVVSISPFAYRFASIQAWLGGGRENSVQPQLRIALPDIPGLPAQQRLQIAMMGAYWYLLRGETFVVRRPDESLAAFRLEMPSDRTATFVQLGVYEPSRLERFFGGRYLLPYNMGRASDQAEMKDGFLYLTEEFGESSVLRPSICVFDLRGSHPMELVAHFAAPGAWIVRPLDDGRALIGGKKLWLVGPPPRR